MTNNEIVKVYDTIMSIPGMSEPVKIDLKITRRNVLLLSNVLERGLTLKDPDDKSSNLLDSMAKETIAELRNFADDCLKKAGMTEFSEKLKALNVK
ncbi:hypothetical protein [Pedobacter sp. WC2423]|uniref:hypothetical protein n=1 Tax=Pedobacter sp. WC2423 TaxID=3234142 RepID=UPI00346679FB